MKIWALLRRQHKIIRDIVIECASPADADAWQDVISGLCHTFDQGRPVLMNKHLNELASFSRTVFFPVDFLEEVAFDKMEIEIISKTV